MTKSKIVMAAIAVAVVCSLPACKRPEQPLVADKPSADAPAPDAKVPPADDKSPQYVKDLRQDMQKARDTGAAEQKAADDQRKAAEDATK